MYFPPVKDFAVTKYAVSDGNPNIEIETLDSASILLVTSGNCKSIKISNQDQVPSEDRFNGLCQPDSIEKGSISYVPSNSSVVQLNSCSEDFCVWRASSNVF